MSGGLGGIRAGLTGGPPEGGFSLPDEQDLAEILSHYPEEKPVCFNYMRARLDVLRLCGIVRQLCGQYGERFLENQSK